MVGGVSLLGVVTATLASWIVQRVAEEDTAGAAATAAQIEELRDEIRKLTESVTGRTDPAYGEAVAGTGRRRLKGGKWPSGSWSGVPGSSARW